MTREPQLLCSYLILARHREAERLRNADCGGGMSDKSGIDTAAQ